MIELAGDARLPVHEREPPAREARGADELSVTSTAGGVMPVTRIDGAPVADGRPGTLTRALSERCWPLHDDPRYTRRIDDDS